MMCSGATRWSWPGSPPCTRTPRCRPPGRAYAGARRDLAGSVPPEAIEETLDALSKEGAQLAAQVREVALVEEALQGRRWRPKL